MPEVDDSQEFKSKPSITDTASLINLVYLKELVELEEFKQILAKRILQDQVPFFKVWQSEVSD